MIRIVKQKLLNCVLYFSFQSISIHHFKRETKSENHEAKNSIEENVKNKQFPQK